jgi:hypothetical protein
VSSAPRGPGGAPNPQPQPPGHQQQQKEKRGPDEKKQKRRHTKTNGRLPWISLALLGFFIAFLGAFSGFLLRFFALSETVKQAKNVLQK